jgi:hypothetical protein
LSAVASHVAAHVSTSRGEVAVVLVAHTASSVEVSAVVVVVVPGPVVSALVTVVAACRTIVPTLLARRDVLR